MAAVIESHNEHNKLSPMTLIRELKEADFEQWLELYQVYAEHYRVALTETGIQTAWVVADGFITSTSRSGGFS
tara:strand:+ start:263 stop:481 length:219 start_codon:yes stop_codon:yes gene_type:complete